MDGAVRPGRLLAGGLVLIFAVSACSTAPQPPVTPLEISAEPVVTGTTGSPTSTTTPAPTTTTTTTTTPPPPPPPPPPAPEPPPPPKPPAKPRNNCDPSYPGVCIPPAPPDLDCGDISHRRFTVLAPDPHGFDGRDNDGIGCESG
jgi:hypothetical protein